MTDVDYELVEAYNKIALKYTALKRKPWKDLQKYMLQISHKFSLPTSGIMLDVGTGNCRNLLLFEKQQWEHIGSDLSFELLSNSITLKKNRLYLINNDMRDFFLRGNCIDFALCIATLHHLRSKNEVLEVLLNIQIALKKDEYLLLSCWRRWKKGTIKRMFKDLIFYPFKKIKDKSWRHGDIYLPWFDKNRKIIAQRYYHLFTRRELLAIVQKTGFEIVNFSKLGGEKGDDNIFLLLKNKK